MDTTIERTRRVTDKAIGWTRCPMCKLYVQYAPRKRWYDANGRVIYRGKLCINCAQELDAEVLIGKMEGQETARKFRKQQREKDKLAKKGWDELKSEVKHR